MPFLCHAKTAIKRADNKSVEKHFRYQPGRHRHRYNNCDEQPSDYRKENRGEAALIQISNAEIGDVQPVEPRMLLDRARTE